MADDISGIPDVDLSNVDLTQPDDKQEDLAQFKTQQDLLKSYKEIQAAFTRVSQENKQLKEQGGNPNEIAELQEQLNSLREEAELMRLQPQQPSVSKSFDDSWMESPEATIDDRVAHKVAQARIEDALELEYTNNPVEYQARYADADALARDPRYANLAKSPGGVHKLFKIADENREKRLKMTSQKSLEYLLGENPTEEQLARFRSMLTGDSKPNKQNNNAYMPDGSTSTKSGADSDSDQDNSRAIREAVNKGDVDGVLDEMFKDISA